MSCGCQSSSGCCGSGECGCHTSCCGGQKSCNCCSCCQCGCQKGSCHGSNGKECHHAEKFLELADCAWMEVLKEKIKDHIRNNAQHLDELAKLVSEANKERWQKKMDNKKCCGHFEDQLKEFFSRCGCSTSSNKMNRG